MSYAACWSQAAEWLRPRLNKEEILVLGPARAAADEFVRSLGEEGTLGLHRLTLTQFAAQLAARKLAERELAPATRLGLEAVAARVIHRLNAEGRLRYLGGVAQYPGFPAALVNTLSDLRLCDAEPPSGDLALLSAEYEAELDSRRAADLATILRLATEALSEWAPVPVVALDLPLPAAAHRRFLDAVAARAPFFHAKSSSAEGSSNLAQVRRHLFSTGKPAAAEPDSTVESFLAPGEPLESVEIARRIRLLGVPFDRVAILLRSPERYQFLIEEALRRAGIPSYFSRGSSRPDPAGRAFLALLHCRAENLSASRFAEYLSLGQVPDHPSASEPGWVPPDDDTFLFTGGGVEPVREEQPAVATPPTPAHWEKLLVDAAVIGGRDRWFRRLAGLRAELELQLSRAEDSERDTVERKLDRLGNLERFALPLIAVLDSLPAAADWKRWLAELRRLAAAALRYPESVLATLAELEPLSEIGPIGIHEVVLVLSERLRFLRREPPHRRYGRVFVGSIEEARARTFDVVFLPGLAEGLFPRRVFEDPLLLDEARREITAELPRRDTRNEDERELLRIALSSASRKLVFSYPSMDVTQGRPRVPSLFALEIARALEGRVPKLESFERDLSARAEARLVWPAPIEPSHAIDDAEYDLAWYRLNEGRKGSSRYLIAESPALARSLRARYRRWEKKWTENDGLIAGAVVPQPLLDRRLTAKPYSPTTLQSFSVCPYKFYLQGVYGLRPREQAAALEQMDPLTRGALFHAVQFRFLSGWRKGDLTEALDQLDRVIAEVTDAYREELAPAIDRVWNSEVEDLRTDLRGWLRQWMAGLAMWEPLHFELSFGLREDAPNSRDTASSRNPVTLGNGAQVRGSVDLVERQRSNGLLRITDHKTGKPPDALPTFVGGGGTLQPVLYGLAVEKLLGSATDAGRLFFCTQRGGFSEITIVIEQARKWFDRCIRIIDESVESAFLPAAPQPSACEQCDYRPVCGPYEHQRVTKFKDSEFLEPLNEVRRMP